MRNEDYEQRYAALKKKGKLYPNMVEIIMGLTLVFCLCFFSASKYEDETMIFMLNPCHVTALLQAICCFCPYNKWTELVALTSFAFNFGGWIGIFFPELEGYSQADITTYYIQHIIASFFGTLVFSLCGRFDCLSYKKAMYYVTGYIMFTTYMREFLMPISLLTWANLNHTLCGTDSDPVWRIFDLGKWYYLLAECYLGAAALAAIAGNFAICYVVKRFVLGDWTCSHDLNTVSQEKLHKKEN